MRVLLVAVLVGLAGPSAAFGHGSSDEGGYTSKVVRIVNAGGIHAAASGDGHFTLTAPAGRTVIVTGYQGEPYVKFADGRIYVNERAPTTYVNRETTRPPDATPEAAPRWVAEDEGLTYTWHDHRTHWMAPEAPSAVRDDPDSAHHVSDWTVSGTSDGERFAIEGSLDWAPAKSGPRYEWISYIALAGFVLYALFVVIVRRTHRREAQRSASASAGDKL